MKIRNSVALVTGANRGLGLALAKALLERGARKVYAAARDPQPIELAGVMPLRLDVTSEADIRAAAATAGDLTLLVNNAGIDRRTSLLADNASEVAHAELETNVFGPLNTSRAFAPILAKNGGGAIINVLSVLSWVNIPQSATYSMSKAAEWSITNGLRAELRGQGTQVLGCHVGYMDTDMAKHIPGGKAPPEAVAKAILDALEAGQSELLCDEISQQVKQGLSSPQAPYLVEQR